MDGQPCRRLISTRCGWLARARYRLVGDVDFEGAKTVASKITPVPVRALAPPHGHFFGGGAGCPLLPGHMQGGVGPMTIAMLMKNTVDAAAKAFGGAAASAAEKQ